MSLFTLRISRRSILVWALLTGLPMLATAGPTSTQPTATTNPFAHLAFRNLGPAVAGGRVSTIAGIPGNPRIFYVGAASGGVWKTTDGGLHFKLIFGKKFTSSIGTIALAPSNPNVIWVGTGSANIRSDVIDGDGIYLSTNAGKTFRRVGLKNAGQIGKILVDPHNPNHVLVAVLGHAWGPNVERGVFETNDAGKSWHKTLYVNDHTGAVDLAMQPGNPQVIFATTWQAVRRPWTLTDGGPGSAIWRSEDGGMTWQRLHGHGLPTGPLGRIAIALAPTQPNLVYALIEAPHHEGLLFASNDLGGHWHKVSDNHALDVRPFYFTQLQVAPNNAKKVYFLAFHLLESDNGGHTAKVIDKGVHVDHHALWIDPRNPQRMIQGNDGGVYLSQNAGKSWRFLNGLPIEQSYAVATDNRKPFDICTGLQDNSGWCGPSNSLSNRVIDGSGWFVVVGGDGEYVVPAPSNPDIIYGNAEDGSTVRFDRKTKLSRFSIPYMHGPSGINDLNTAAQKYRFNWTAPLAVDPHHANTVYLGANVLFKSTDGGLTWKPISPDLTRNDKSKQQLSGGPINLDLSGAETYDTIQSITLAPTQSRTIWVGTDDGLVQLSRNGGTSWHNVTPNGAPKWARVYQIGVSPFDAGTAYVAFDAHMLDNRHPYVFRTTDYGQHWQRIDRGLPNNDPVLVVREDPNQRGFLAAGTMAGVWISRNNGDHWQKLETKNFPTVSVWDLQFAHHDLILGTHGRGVFVFDHFSTIAAYTPKITPSPLHLFSPSIGVEWQRWSRGEGAEPSYTAANAPDGVIVDYWLPKKLKSDTAQKASKQTPVKIVVTDARGQIVATRWGAAKTGVNRFVWDMSWDGPTRLSFGKHAAKIKSANHSGPAVLPGTYTLTVFANGQHQGTPVRVEYDPNQHFDAKANKAALQLALTERNQLSTINQLLNRVSTWQAKLSSFEHQAQDAGSSMDTTQRTLLSKAQVLSSALAKLRNRIYNPKVQHTVIEDGLHQLTDLHGAVAMTYGMVAYLQNQAPIPAMRALAKQYTTRVSSVIIEFNALLATPVAHWNQAAYAAGVTTLPTGKPLQVKSAPVI